MRHLALAQGLSGDGCRTACAVQAGKLAIEVLGKGEGVAVVNRSVPAQYVGDTGADEFAHEGFAAAGAGVSLLGCPTGRQENQGQHAGVAQRADKLAHSGQRQGAGFILQGQDWPLGPVDVAMAGEVQGFKRAVQVEAFTQGARCATLFDHQVQGQALGGGEDGGFFLLEAEGVLAPGRGGHEEQLQVGMARFGGRGFFANAPGQFKELDAVVGQMALGKGEEFPGGVEQGQGEGGIDAGDADFQLARATAPRPGAGPAALVQPFEQLPPDGQQGCVIAPSAGDVIAGCPALERG